MLSKKEFARLSGVSQKTITRCESLDEEHNPSLENVESFSQTLSFPVGFFYLDDIDVADIEITSFRSLTSMTALIREAALAAGSIGFEVSDWIEDQFALPEVQIPDLSSYGAKEPAHAARILREEWRLGEKPISNIIHLLESKGARIFSLCENTLKVNAYSLWRNEKPYLFLNTQKSSECSRFDAAHELGHLVLHQDGKTKGRDAEDQANAFASSFLMPRRDILANIPKVKNLNHLIDLKTRWKVSLAALCYRLHKLGILTDWKYRDYCILLSKYGYNKNEPNSIDREQSIVWNKVLNSLWSEQKTHYDIAEVLCLPIDEVEGLIFGILSKANVSFLPESEGSYLRLMN